MGVVVVVVVVGAVPSAFPVQAKLVGRGGRETVAAKGFSKLLVCLRLLLVVSRQ